MSKLHISVQDDEAPADVRRIEINVPLNPKDLKMSRSVPWQTQATNQGGEPKLEFTKTEPRTFEFELVIDVYQSEEHRNRLNQEYIDKFWKLAETHPDIGRPPRIYVVWGGLRLLAAITSVSVTYSMFLADGTPVRASVSLQMKEALKELGVAPSQGEGGGEATTSREEEAEQAAANDAPGAPFV